MEVTLSPDLQAKLTCVARDRGTDAQALAREAIERLVDYDDWFLREVEKGLAQIERGETLGHEDVGVRLEQRLSDKRSRPSCRFAGPKKQPTISSALPTTF